MSYKLVVVCDGCKFDPLDTEGMVFYPDRETALRLMRVVTSWLTIAGENQQADRHYCPDCIAAGRVPLKDAAELLGDEDP